MQKIALVLFVWVLSSPIFAEVRMDAVFSDDMVLQRDLPVPVWG